MPDPVPPAAPGGAPPPAAPGAAPAWHNGIESEMLGLWQNKGYNVDDPKALVTELT